jgi:hypothetical protein
LEASSVFDALKKLLQACKMRLYVDAEKTETGIRPIFVVHGGA